MTRGEYLNRVRQALLWRGRRLGRDLALARARADCALNGIEVVCDLLHHSSDSALIERLLVHWGATLGPGTYFKGYLTIDNASGDDDATNDFRHLSIGRRVFVGKNVSLDLPARIVIHDEAIISAGVTILTHADCGQRQMSRYFPRKTGDVEIGFGSWLGANATVLCGVTIGNDCVVGASALVAESVPDGEIWAGVPARKIGTAAERSRRDRG